MKKVIFTLFSLFLITIGFSQTYYWIGGTTATSFTSASNWNTTLGGGGTNLPASISGTNSTGYTFVIDGTDLSSAAGAQTGPLSAAFTGTINIGQLILQNGADVTLARSGSSGTVTITTVGLSGTDFVVNPGSKLSLTGTIGSMLISIPTGATAEIGGDLFLLEGNTVSGGYNNRFTAVDKGSFVFLSGSSITTETAYNAYPFNTGSSSTPAGANSVVFNAGSSFYFKGGLSPFGSTSTLQVVEFKPGSKFYFMATPVGTGSSTLMFSGRAYADVIVRNNATVIADGSLNKMDSLRIEAGSKFIADSSGSTPVLSHILNNGTLQVPATNPDRGNRLVMAGSTPQNIGGTGTFMLGKLVVSNASAVTLQKAIQVDSSTIVVGTLNPGGFSITGPGTISTKAPDSRNVTGTIVVDSFLVKNISDMTGVEVGMSVTGTGIPAGTVVVNLSTSNSTITLSKPATSSAASTPLVIFNGQGVVLPVKFGSISAALKNGKAKVSWTILTEENIFGYSVERSANSREFTEVGYVQASGVKQYSLLDESPLAGNNYYRVKAIGKDGDIKYSVVVKVFNGISKGDIAVYPNPVKGGELNVQLNNMDKGSYSLRLINSSGQLLLNKAIVHQGGSLNQVILLPASVKPGVYSLQVSGAEISVQRKVLVQ